MKRPLPAMVSEVESAVSPQYPLDRIAFQRLGDPSNPAILVLHGWASSAQVMMPLARALSANHNVFVVDLPGHGQSPPPDDGMDIPSHANLVMDFIETHIQKPVTLLGHSNGGRIGLYMSSTDGMRDRISRLILISPSGIKPKRTPSYYVKVGTAKTLKAPFSVLPEPLRSHGLRWVRGTFVWQALGSSDYKTARGPMRQVFTMAVRFFVDDMLKRIECPVLLIWGDRDTAVSKYQVDKLRDGIRDVTFHQLNGASHYGFIDDPDNTLEAISSFLEVTS